MWRPLRNTEPVSAERLDLVHAVRDVERCRRPRALQLGEHGVDLLDVGAGQRRGRLVEDQELGVACRAPWRSRPSGGATAAGRAPATRGIDVLAADAGEQLLGAAALGAAVDQAEAARRIGDARCCPRPRGRASATVPGRCRRCRRGWRSAGVGERSPAAVDSDIVAARRAATTPDMILIRVDLPAPFSPSTAWIEPRRQEKSTPSSARTPP